MSSLKSWLSRSGYVTTGPMDELRPQTMKESPAHLQRAKQRPGQPHPDQRIIFCYWGLTGFLPWRWRKGCPGGWKATPRHWSWGLSTDSVWAAPLPPCSAVNPVSATQQDKTSQRSPWSRHPALPAPTALSSSTPCLPLHRQRHQPPQRRHQKYSLGRQHFLRLWHLLMRNFKLTSLLSPGRFNSDCFLTRL